ncbi:restriction endonuclease subunit S [Dolichospermum sp. UHCC 0352]|uniref:restriction endonuclease subunit S n=1 Tax=Dolichospermum sp. UHCC 0352 TaxID=2590011 RepID=UPI0014489620|nr:restriction endonuclease subunit S [Dolichospermum sp. UHCC 0352]MTJ23426.1 restriction endonuclease subunit S [Dolichospermum sp. UHCC 0352]
MEYFNKKTDYKQPNWIKTTLGKCFRLINGRAYSQVEMLNSGTPIIRIQNLHGSEKWYYSDLQLPEDQYCDKGDLLCAWSATFGPFIWNGTKSIYHYHIWKVEPTPAIDKKFAYYLLTNITTSIKAASHGISMLHMTKEGMEKWEVDIPPLPEQKRIAAILEKCDRLRRTRRYSLQLSETFLQSVFLEMFGDPVTNPMGWFIKNLDDVADIASGVTKGQKFNGKQTVQVPYMRVANVQDGYLDLTDIKLIEALPQEVEQLKLQKGDILMTEGGDYDKLGRGAIWHGQIENCIHQNHIFRVRTNRKIILPEFFAKLLLTQYTKLYFLQCSKQTTNLATINMTQLKALPVPLPPLPLQEKFAQIVQKHERFRTQQREAERQAEHLFQTLLYRAFRGELTSSDSNELDISALSAENHPQQPKPKSTDKPENLPIPATQPQINALQLTLPGLE